MTLEEQKENTNTQEIWNRAGAQQHTLNTSSTNIPRSVRLTTGNTSIHHSDLPCPSQKHIHGTKTPGHCSRHTFEHHTSKKFNEKASCTSSDEPALGKHEKSAIFKVTCILKTEPPAHVGQASPTWNTDQTVATSQGSRAGLSREQNSHRKGVIAIIIFFFIIIISIYLRGSQEN